MKRLFLTLLTAVLIAGCSKTDNLNENTTHHEDTQQKKKEVKVSPEKKMKHDDRLNVGDETTIDDITFTINHSEFTDERIPDYYESFEYVVKLDVTYENNSQDVFPAGRDITLEVNDNIATYYDMEDTLLEDVKPGESVSGPLYFAFNGTPETMTATFEPLLNNQEETAHYNVYPDVE